MKFIVLTNPSKCVNVVEELVTSGLIPEMVVTNSPFYVENKSWFDYLYKRLLKLIRYVLKKERVRKNHHTFFYARKQGIRVFDSNRVNTKEFADLVRELEIDFAFTFGFRMLKKQVYSAPKKGCINFHPSYLPFNRGKSPSNWVILKNQNFTGFTFHFIDQGIDTGKIIYRHKVSLTGFETADIVDQYLFSMGQRYLVQLIYKLINGLEIETIERQNEIGSYEQPFSNYLPNLNDSLSSSDLIQIVKASRYLDRGAIFRHNNHEYKVINCIGVCAGTKPNKKTPYVDDDMNIIVRTSDDKYFLLIVDKSKT